MDGRSDARRVPEPKSNRAGSRAARRTTDTQSERRVSILPPFGASVLEPGLDLRVGHLQRLGQGGALGRRQVLLPVEALLQLADLHAAEGRARLFPLGRRAVLVRVTDAPRH